MQVCEYVEKTGGEGGRGRGRREGRGSGECEDLRV